MSNSFNLLENASNSDPLEIASTKTKEVKQEKPKVEEKKAVQQTKKPKVAAAASSEAVAVEEGFQGTRSKVRGGRQQHQGYQPPKKGRSFDRHVSGTGKVKGEVKKGGNGKANWGKSTEQVKEEKPVEEQSEAVGEQTPVEEKKAVEESTPAVVAPVDNSLTLDEYFSQKKSSVSKVTLKKEAGEQLVTGKSVKIGDAAFERPSDELFQKEKKKVEKTSEKKVSNKPKTIDVSQFLDTASIEKMKERRDRELLEGPKQPFERRPRTQGDRPQGDRPQGDRPANKGGKPQNRGPKTANSKPASGAPKKARPVINKEKDFPALNPQN